MNPETLALDEPTAGLDPQGRREFIELIRNLRRERALTVVYLTSSLDDVADMADYIYILDSGMVAFEGTPREVMRQLPALERLGVGLSGVSRLALKLSEVFPNLDTSSLDLDTLETDLLMRLLPAPRAARSPNEEVAP
jgi:energy-coupling factor transport system ATP-binding protein